MKKLSIVIVVALVSFSFSSKEVRDNNISNEITLLIQQEILQINQIIDDKQEEARLLELKAKELVENDNKEAVKLIEQVNLLKMNCLKYQAAIACKEQYLLK